MSQQYAIYLRKSRADRDAELRGEGETLARHREALTTLAERMNLEITHIYEEVVSGESIQNRPEVQQLLDDVEAGMYAGVLVMEVERLARGNTKDQGIVAEAFSYSRTKIITPIKTYDPSDEFDEEYFEFGLFMSRREYKTINRRIQRGRLASVQEGKYISPVPPYGYDRIKIPDDKGYMLSPNEKEAPVVKLIFDLYINQGKGIYAICKHLDSMGIKPRRKDTWSTASVKDILTNPTYTGKIRWQWRKEVKTIENGIRVTKRPKDENCMLIDGLHEALIDDETYAKAQHILSTRGHAPVASNKELKNPLSGIVYCGKCGSLLTRVNSNTKAGYFSLMCPNRSCDCVSSPIYLIEKSIIDSLTVWLEAYKLKVEYNVEKPDETTALHLSSLEALHEEQIRLQKQLDNTYDLLEQGVYTVEVFQQRNQTIQDKINKTTAGIQRMEEEIANDKMRELAFTRIIPDVQHVINSYDSTTDVQAKNDMLKAVLEKVSYVKTEAAKKGKRDSADITIHIFPRLPKK